MHTYEKSLLCVTSNTTITAYKVGRQFTITFPVFIRARERKTLKNDGSVRKTVGRELEK